MNGVFTEKRGLAYGKMFEYMRNVMRIAATIRGKGHGSECNVKECRLGAE